MEPSPEPCSHHYCRGKGKGAKGVAVCVVDVENASILLGRERFGRYANRFNVAAGSIEAEDGQCIAQAARRELREELKLEMSPHEWDWRARVVMYLGVTPVFLVRFRAHELPPTETLNARMASEIADPNLPGCFKEMSEARWMPLDEAVASSSVTSFGQAILRRLRSRSLFPRFTVYHTTSSDRRNTVFHRSNHLTQYEPRQPHRNRHQCPRQPPLGVQTHLPRSAPKPKFYRDGHRGPRGDEPAHPFHDGN
jgi:8-oxo-dGTP pyrophosphatase MutT (NUDIX family)